MKLCSYELIIIKLLIFFYLIKVFNYLMECFANVSSLETACNNIFLVGFQEFITICRAGQ